jgi:hypothetical protein
VEINDPTHLTGHVCVDVSRDEEKYQDFGLSGCDGGGRQEGRQTFIRNSTEIVCRHISCNFYFFIFFVFLPQQLYHPRPTHSLPVKMQLRH